MPLVERYLAIIAKLGLAAGAVGFSGMLGALVPVAASEPPSGSSLTFTPTDSIAERLAAVRAAVSTLGTVPGEARSACWGNIPGVGPCGNWTNFSNWHNWNNAHIWPNTHVFPGHH